MLTPATSGLTCCEAIEYCSYTTGLLPRQVALWKQRKNISHSIHRQGIGSLRMNNFHQADVTFISSDGLKTVIQDEKANPGYNAVSFMLYIDSRGDTMCEIEGAFLFTQRLRMQLFV